ncbi:MAG TPA: hypothetical protein VE242_06380 [Chthoniobacterales bacterium]|nr:hypothetical protein [Chthoniobacterales bacterium]
MLSTQREREVRLVELKGILLAWVLGGDGSITIQHVGNEFESFRLQ